jgi:CRISPR-associated protein Cas1
VNEVHDAEPLAISLVAHHVFCPRRAWLEAAGERTDTAQMAAGSAAHRATDDPTTGREGVLRGAEVVSERLGVVGRCDTVELAPDGSATIVEYKATPVRRRPELTDAMKVQVLLQAMALEEMGYAVSGQYVYFTGHRVRVPVPRTPADVERAENAVRATATTLASRDAPAPLEDDPRCTACSHAGVCLPDERKLEPVRRRIVVGDPDTQVLHLSTPGSRASTRDGRLLVHHQGEALASIPLERVQAVVVHGNVDLTGGLLRELLWRGLPVVFTTGTGRVVGWATAAAGPNGASRVRQHLASAEGRLDLAREFVAAKITNQATLLRRLGAAPTTVIAMRRLARTAQFADSLGQLLGYEGDAAAAYFEAFPTMLKGPAVELGSAFATRTRRPARDPVNAALNYAYALLLGDVVRAILATGLDPHAGFLHSSNRNKPALALDLCEEFRAPVADSTVVGAFNNGELSMSDFASVLGTTTLRPAGRRSLIAAYERRASGTFRHPTFDYLVTWRRAMEIQARLVLGVLDGTQARYRGIRVR